MYPNMCTLWLGVGLAYMHLEEIGNAELAMCEANVVDNRNPCVWGYLALLASKSGRIDDAELVN